MKHVYTLRRILEREPRKYDRDHYYASPVTFENSWKAFVETEGPEEEDLIAALPDSLKEYLSHIETELRKNWRQEREAIDKLKESLLRLKNERLYRSNHWEPTKGDETAEESAKRGAWEKELEEREARINELHDEIDATERLSRVAQGRRSDWIAAQLSHKQEAPKGWRALLLRALRDPVKPAAGKLVLPGSSAGGIDRNAEIDQASFVSTIIALRWALKMNQHLVTSSSLLYLPVEFQTMATISIRRNAVTALQESAIYIKSPPWSRSSKLGHGLYITSKDWIFDVEFAEDPLKLGMLMCSSAVAKSAVTKKEAEAYYDDDDDDLDLGSAEVDMGTPEEFGHSKDDD